MKNKTNKFGYLNDVDIERFLRVNPKLRGCNVLDEHALTTYPNIEEKLVFESYTYKKILSKSDDYLLNMLYNHILVMDVISQIEDSIFNNGGVFCSFEKYECPRAEVSSIMDSVVAIFLYRGFNVNVEGNIIRIINTPVGTEFEDMRIFGTINVKYTIQDMEEMLFRSCAELLKHIPIYNEITKEWNFRKSTLACVVPEYTDIVSSSYFALKLFGYIEGVLDECETELNGEDLAKIQNSDSVVMNDLLDMLIQCAQSEDTEDLIGELIEKYRVLEERLDQYFTADMEIAVCKDFKPDFISLAMGYFFRADEPITEPVSLDFTADFEAKSFSFNKKYAVAASVVLILAIIVYIMGM